MKTLKSRDFFPRVDYPFMITRNNIAEYPVHRHEFYEFFYVVTGKCLHILEGKEEVVASGDIILLEPGRSHGLIKALTGQFEVFNCIFLPELLDSHAALLKNVTGFLEFMYLEPFKKGFNRLHLTGPVNLKTLIILEELFLEYGKKPRGFETAIKILLADLLITLVRFNERQKAELPGKSGGLNRQASAIMKSLEYIEANFRKDISLEDISLNKAGITKEYYCNIFKKVTGKTFTEYINALRIEYAARLLSGSGKPVTEIAYDSGFNDLSYFNRVFKAAKGISPSKYREKQNEQPAGK